MSQKTPEQLQAALDAAEAENKALAQKLAGLEKSNAKLKEQRKELQEELKVKEATKGSKLPTVNVDGEPYIFTGPRARVNREIMKAEDAAQNATLCKELVAKNDGWLKKVVIK